MLSNLHTHTTFCDGKSTAEETVLEAIKKGDADLADRLTSLHVRRALENMLSAVNRENGE